MKIIRSCKNCLHGLIDGCKIKENPEKEKGYCDNHSYSCIVNGKLTQKGDVYED